MMNLVRCKHSNHDVMLVFSKLPPDLIALFSFLTSSCTLIELFTLCSILSPFSNCCDFRFSHARLITYVRARLITYSLPLINNALLFLYRCGLASRCSSRASISTKVTPYQSVRQCNSIWIISTRYPLWTLLRCLVFIPMQT